MTTDNITLAACTILVVATIFQCLENDFVWDDQYLVEEFDGLGDVDKLGDILTSSFWENSSYLSYSSTSFWRPATSALLWLGGFLFGKWPPGFHLISVLGALGAAVSFAFFLSSLQKTSYNPRIFAWFGLIFLIHPLNAEVMCMIANVSDHLALGFLSIHMMLLVKHYISPETTKWYRLPLAGLMAFLAACSKEVGVIAAAAPLLAYLLCRAASHPLPLRKLAMIRPWAASFIPVALYLILRTAIVSEGIAKSLKSHSDFGLDVVLIGWGQALWSLIVPISRGAHAITTTNTLFEWTLTVAALLLFVATITVSIVKTKSLNTSALGLIIALTFLLPSLLTVDKIGDVLNLPTRYFHLPLAGLLIAVMPVTTRNWTKGLRLAAPLFVVLLTLLSWIRINEWKDNVSFHFAELTYRPTSIFNQINLAAAYLNAKAFTDAEKVLDSLNLEQQGLSRTHTARAYSMKCRISLLRDNDLEKANNYIQKASTIDPTDLGILFDLAELKSIMGHPDQAIIIMEKAAQNPLFQDYRKKEIKKTIEHYQAKTKAALFKETSDLLDISATAPHG